MNNTETETVTLDDGTPIILWEDLGWPVALAVYREGDEPEIGLVAAAVQQGLQAIDIVDAGRNVGAQITRFDDVRPCSFGPYRRQMRFAAGRRPVQGGGGRGPVGKGIDERHGPLIAGRDDEIGATYRAARLERQNQLCHAARRPRNNPRRKTLL